jgi:hypothetical protein
MGEDPVQISHGGSQGFKSPHLHPQPRRSERRQRRVGGAHCMLRPRCGRNLKSQCSPKALRGHPTQAQASHDDHAAWSPPAASRWAILARIPASFGRPPGRPGPVPTTSHDDDQVQVDLRWPSTACASFERQAPTLGRRHAAMDTAGDHADPGHPSRAAAGPTATPHKTSLPSDTADAATHRHRTPDTGHLDAQTPAPDTGHWTGTRRTPDARTGHWTPDAGHGHGHGHGSTAGIRTSLAATPSDRTLRRPPMLCPRTTRQLLGRSAGQAAPRRTAVLR